VGGRDASSGGSPAPFWQYRSHCKKPHPVYPHRHCYLRMGDSEFKHALGGRRHLSIVLETRRHGPPGAAGEPSPLSMFPIHR
jgi:hypothetical protein